MPALLLDHLLVVDFEEGGLDDVGTLGLIAQPVEELHETTVDEAVLLRERVGPFLKLNPKKTKLTQGELEETTAVSH